MQRAFVWSLLFLAPTLPACVFDLADVLPNRTANPSFEVGTAGWEADYATLSRLTIEDAPDGCCVARVAYDGDGGDAYYTINDHPDTLEKSSVAGATYRASAWVRSAIDPPNPKATVSIILEEGGSPMSDEVKIPLGTKFSKLEMVGVAGDAGHTITVHVRQYDPVPGDAFDIDLLRLLEEPPSGD